MQQSCLYGECYGPSIPWDRTSKQGRNFGLRQRFSGTIFFLNQKVILISDNKSKL